MFTIDLPLAWKSLPAMLHGMLITAELVSIVVVLGIILSIPLALGRMSRNPVFNWLSWAFVIFFRGTPLLVLLYLVYYGLSQFGVVRQSPFWFILRDPFACAVIAVTLNHSSYVVEVVRGSLLAVPSGLIEAAGALGISPRDTFRWVQLPLAVRYGFKAYQNEVVGFTKGTAVVSAITVVDITAVASDVFQTTYDPLTPMLEAAVMYWLLVNVIRYVFAIIERRLNRHLTPVQFASADIAATSKRSVAAGPAVKEQLS